MARFTNDPNKKRIYQGQNSRKPYKIIGLPKRRLSYHLCVECFSQLSFDSEVYTKSAAVADG